MKMIVRGVRSLLLLSLFFGTMIVFAQQDDDSSSDELAISGSRIVISAVEAIAEANDFASPAANIVGTSSGFNALCDAQAPVAGAIRPISVEEELLCQNNGISYAEYLIGYNVLTFVIHPDLTFASCLTPNQINTLFAPSSQDRIDDWAQIGLETLTNVPLTLITPDENSVVYGLLDAQLEGFGLRGDVQTEADNAAVIAAVASTEGAIGVVSGTDVSTDDGVQVVQIRNPDLNRCITPETATAETGEYAFFNPLLLYVNTAEVAEGNELLSLIVSEEAVPALVDAGYTPPSEDTYALNAAILRGEAEDGRQFSRDLVAFQIPDDVFGVFTMGGAASLATYAQSTTATFNAEYPTISAELAIDGQTAAIRRFCNGELDIVAINRDLTEEEITICQNNAVSPLTFDIGAQAAILVGNATPDEEADDDFALDDFPDCLTREQVQMIWGSSSDVPTSWVDVDPDFPAADLILVAPNLGSVDYTDILLTTDDGLSLPERLDVAERRNDPAYRAAAVGNVRGGLTYMSWIDYENIEEVRPDNIRLISIRADGECVTPSIETIGDGSYPYTLRGNLIINQSALTRPEVQSFVWYLFQDSSYSLFASGGLTGLNFGDLSVIRERLEVAFVEAEAAPTPPPTVDSLPPRDFAPSLPFDLLTDNE
ncbi:MAG: hypothetical protein EA396_13980 [Anaerolineaceae bacterium]|nr:MAG: hypothetical protein EA396_13980 [Anaerolineaceae bacterium]